ncbi:MAG: acyl carrier protein [Candidatus Acidiferrales bacterium]
MNKAEIERQIREYVVKNFLYGRADALRDDTMLLGNVIDSTGALELMGFLQSNFSITMDDEDVVPENLESIDKVVAYVERKLPTKA